MIDRRVTSFGEKICSLPNLLEQKNDSLRITFISCIVTIICAISVTFLTSERLLFAFSIFPLTIITRCLLIKSISSKNGIYEKGIILGMFIKYKKIKSYKKTDSGEILLFFKNGRSCKIMTKENIEEIELILSRNNIQIFHT
jgi:hypothetical protein